MTETMWLVIAVITLAALLSLAVYDRRTEKAAHERTKADLDNAREVIVVIATEHAELTTELANAHGCLDLVLGELPREMTA